MTDYYSNIKWQLIDDDTPRDEPILISDGSVVSSGLVSVADDGELFYPTSDHSFMDDAKYWAAELSGPNAHPTSTIDHLQARVAELEAKATALLARMDLNKGTITNDFNEVMELRAVLSDPDVGGE